MNKIKRALVNNGFGIFSPEKKVSNLQMSLTLIMVISLVLSNILVVKPIDLFGVEALANTCSMFVFPLTYILSDVFSEVYGYKWSRVTSTWAFLGTLFCSLFFALMIGIQGNASWQYQTDLVHILGNTPRILFASLLAFWIGDWANDLVYRKLKAARFKGNGVCVRAILSSLVGKYVDGLIFTFIGLSFLPLRVKLIMVLNCPFIQICMETALLPLTKLLIGKIKKAEALNDSNRRTGANSTL